MKEYKYKINGTKYTVGIGDINDNVAQVEVNGTPYRVELANEKTVTIVNTPRPEAAPRTATGEKIITKATVPATGNSVKAPLPGVVLAINVKVGDTVKAADTVIVLEAMKMENAIHAGADGKVTAIHVNNGDSVLEGAPLITIG